MSIEPSNNSNQNLSDPINNENKNITCKDGFCFLPNVEKKETIDHKNINIFDPI